MALPARDPAGPGVRAGGLHSPGQWLAQDATVLSEDRMGSKNGRRPRATRAGVAGCRARRPGDCFAREVLRERESAGTAVGPALSRTARPPQGAASRTGRGMSWY